jgi:hypothetical protein
MAAKSYYCKPAKWARDAMPHQKTAAETGKARISTILGFGSSGPGMRKFSTIGPLLFGMVALLSSAGVGQTARETSAITSIRVKMPAPRSPVVDNTVDLLRRQIETRCATRVKTFGTGDFTIELTLSEGIGKEGFRIENGADGAVRIIGNDERGLLYGIGKFLRTSRYRPDAFVPSQWRGASVPQGTVRGVFLATHFNNFYQNAPLRDVQHYVEELAFWGVNAVKVCLDMEPYTSWEDPACQKQLQQVKTILQTVKNLGLDVCFARCANEGFQEAPQEIRAVPLPDSDTRGNHGNKICPNKPGGKEYILQQHRRVFEALSDIGLDYLSLWPYDNGGCACPQCRPWGSNGFVMICKAISDLARRYFPNCKIVVYTWLFDGIKNPAGEWQGLSDALAKDNSWVQYIGADGAGRDFPRYPLDKGVPGSLPLLNFPEISMYGMSPWGGYGANPLPERLQRLWDQTKGKLAGGWPYSEGIYEDINKAICIQFYWDKDKPATDTVREYIACEFSADADVGKDILEAIGILEKNHLRDSQTFHIGPDAATAFALLEKAQNRMTPQARQAWRWRILYLRALIDDEVFRNHLAPKPIEGNHNASMAGIENGFIPNMYHGNLEGPVLKSAFVELTEIFYAEKSVLRPPQLP